MPTVFVLSPARCSSERAHLLTTSQTAPLARRLRSKEGAPIGEVFAFLSALYFRGKLAYAERFSTAAPLVIAPGVGLAPAHRCIHGEDIAAMGLVDVSSKNDAFVRPLKKDVAILAGDPGVTRVVLLGSIATGKYTDTLVEALGPRLMFPADFVGRGDMSRGGLLLRASKSGEELPYAPLAGAVLRGTRPPRLPRLRLRCRPCAAQSSSPPSRCSDVARRRRRRREAKGRTRRLRARQSSSSRRPAACATRRPTHSPSRRFPRRRRTPI